MDRKKLGALLAGAFSFSASGAEDPVLPEASGSNDNSLDNVIYGPLNTSMPVYLAAHRSHSSHSSHRSSSGGGGGSLFHSMALR